MVVERPQQPGEGGDVLAVVAELPGLFLEVIECRQQLIPGENGWPELTVTKIPPPSLQESRPALGVTFRLPTRLLTASATPSRFIRPAATAWASSRWLCIRQPGDLVPGRFRHASVIDHGLDGFGQREQGLRPW